MKRVAASVGALGAVVLTSGCHVDMWQQPRVNPNSRSEFYPDQQGSRPLVEGTVVHGGESLVDPYHTGRDGKKPVATIPAEAVRALGGPAAMLERGQNRFGVYCTPCHGVLGNGNGFIALRGLGYWQKLPANLHQPRLKKALDGTLFDVLSNGKGAMYGYAARIPKAEDRWAVVAYVRALQSAGPAPAPTAAPAPAEGASTEGGEH